ncbi:MAG: aminotransferase class IV [Planctomycetota bacterium]|jgi:branched-subunit amino acid aminotransferase/4-amino-4-deoxychorismate lyase
MSEAALTSVIDASGGDITVEVLPVDSLSLGKGVFETALVLNGKVAFATRHLARLVRSCKALNIAAEEEARAIFAVALERTAAFPEARARLRLAVFAAAGGRPAVGLVALRPAPERREPLALAVARSGRSAGSLILGHKTVDYLENSLERGAAVAAGFDDALWLDAEGNVAETTTANIFFREGGALITPPAESILPGIVRGWVLETAPSLTLEVRERHVEARTIASFEHAFVTNSIVGLAGVVCIGDNRYSDPSSADWFLSLLDAYRRALTAVG